MTPLTKTISIVVTPALAGAVCLDCGVMNTGWTLIIIAVVALCFSPVLMMVLESRETSERLRQINHGNSVGET